VPTRRAENPHRALKRLLANGPLTGLPTRRSDLELLLGLAISRFEAPRTYREAEVNELLRDWLKTFSAPFGIDHVTLRRCLIDSQHLERDPSGSTYRVRPGRMREPEPVPQPADVLAEIRSERAARKRKRATPS
jgi:hypothetical protein